MEEEKKKKEKVETEVHQKLIKETEKLINDILDAGIQTDNLEYLDKLVDIHKDAKEEEKMMYGNYGNYGNNYGRNYGRGNYGREQYNDNSYGRRGVDARYRGHDYIDGMYDSYGRYEEGRNEYNRGNYSAKEDTLTSLKYMLESATDFFKMLKSEANSQEEAQLIRQYAQKISEM